jgi:hypothetical protein
VNLNQKNEIKRRWQWPWWVMLPLLLFLSGMMLFWAHRSAEAWRARNAILKLLDAPDDQFAVTVNGQPTPNGRAVLQAMRGVHSMMAHHSHPDHKIPIVIRREQEVLELTLGRDSDLGQEYWIFWTREAANPNRLEIGRIRTSVFDGQ